MIGRKLQESFFFFFAVKDGEPDDKELSRLAQESTLLRGKLGRELGVPQGYQDEVSVNHKGDAYEMTFQVLLWWRKNSSATSRYQELFDALTKIGCRDLAEKYCCCWFTCGGFEEKVPAGREIAL